MVAAIKKGCLGFKWIPQNSTLDTTTLDQLVHGTGTPIPAAAVTHAARTFAGPHGQPKFQGFVGRVGHLHPRPGLTRASGINGVERGIGASPALAWAVFALRMDRVGVFLGRAGQILVGFVASPTDAKLFLIFGAAGSAPCTRPSAPSVFHFFTSWSTLDQVYHV